MRAPRNKNWAMTLRVKINISHINTVKNKSRISTIKDNIKINSVKMRVKISKVKDTFKNILNSMQITKRSRKLNISRYSNTKVFLLTSTQRILNIICIQDMWRVSKAVVTLKAVWSTVSNSKAMNQANCHRLQATCHPTLTNETQTSRMQSIPSMKLASQELVIITTITWLPSSSYKQAPLPVTTSHTPTNTTTTAIAATQACNLQLPASQSQHDHAFIQKKILHI